MNARSWRAVDCTNMRERRYREDLTFAQWHRKRLPELYPKAGIGHRLCLADRDWTEYCAHCKEPLAILEEVVDRGQNLNEKSVTVTRCLAERSRLEAYLIAPRMERPYEVQQEIDLLQAKIGLLERKYPIVEFSIKQLHPRHLELQRFTPDEAAQFFYLIHRKHHRYCDVAAARCELPVSEGNLQRALYQCGVMPYEAPRLFLDSGRARKSG